MWIVKSLFNRIFGSYQVKMGGHILLIGILVIIGLISTMGMMGLLWLPIAAIIIGIGVSMDRLMRRNGL